jgi:putative flippase GtrA
LFNVGGVAFFVIGYAVFSVLYGLLHWNWLVAKIIGDTLGWLSNFVIQYFLAFREERRGQKHRVVASKFTVISLLNLIIDYAIVGLLKLVGVSPFIGLIIASQFFTIWKWLWYKHFVFKPKTKQRDPTNPAKPGL